MESGYVDNLVVCIFSRNRFDGLKLFHKVRSLLDLHV